MKRLLRAFKSSVGKKITMALTGLFLVSFLVVHAGVNALIFYNDGGATFNRGAHFMGTNPIIRIIEVALVAGLLLHMIQSLLLWRANRAARMRRYAMVKHAPRQRWYSRSMTLLGILILFFLIVHTSGFWIPNRVHQLRYGEELPLYTMMLAKFADPATVVIYLAGVCALFWHLLHGFSSAFQSLGLSHRKYSPLIKFAGMAFSGILCTVFAMMPVAILLKWIN